MQRRKGGYATVMVIIAVCVATLTLATGATGGSSGGGGGGSKFRKCSVAEIAADAQSNIYNRLSHNTRQAILYAANGCCIAKETPAFFARGTTTQHSVAYRLWICPESAEPTLATAMFTNDADDSDSSTEVIDHPIDLDTIPWNLDRIDQHSGPINGAYTPFTLPSMQYQGRAHVYVIDTGIDPNHDAFSRITIDVNTFPSPYGSNIDCNGHGSHVSSTVASKVGISNPSSDNSTNLVIHATRVLSCAGDGYTSDVIDALVWIQNNGLTPAIISMSLGAPKSTTLNDIINKMVVDRGFVVVVAAGNDNIDACTRSPSSAKYAITVGATAEDDSRAIYSNYGSCVDLFAPGNNIWGVDAGTSGSYIKLSGTSMATPHVSGAIARCIIARQGTTAATGSDCILSAVVPNRVINAGPYSPNKFLYVGSSVLGTTPSQPPPLPTPPSPSSSTLPPQPSPPPPLPPTLSLPPNPPGTLPPPPPSTPPGLFSSGTEAPTDIIPSPWLAFIVLLILLVD